MTDQEEPDRSPSVERSRYYCPHHNCRAFANHKSGNVFLQFPPQGATHEAGWTVHRCDSCSDLTLWRQKAGTGYFDLVYPLRESIGAKANPDMPDHVREIYDEARQVAAISSRSAAALLRLALQLLVDKLEPDKGDLNNKIGRLVKRGLLVQTQQAMDVLRVVGNHMVHPGQIDLDDNPDLVPGLFVLVNQVVEQMISAPKHAEALYDSLPESARERIEQRDAAS